MKKGFVGILGGILGFVIGTVATGKITGEAVNRSEKKVLRLNSYYNILNQWLSLKQNGKTIEKYFIDNEYENIAIYGMGELGNRLYDELKNTNIKVNYAVDKNPETVYTELAVKSLNDEMEPVDVVVITAVHAFDEILGDIRDKFNCDIVSLEAVVYEQ